MIPVSTVPVTTIRCHVWKHQLGTWHREWTHRYCPLILIRLRKHFALLSSHLENPTATGPYPYNPPGSSLRCVQSLLRVSVEPTLASGEALHTCEGHLWSPQLPGSGQVPSAPGSVCLLGNTSPHGRAWVPDRQSGCRRGGCC